MSEHWTAAELKEFYRTGREPIRQSIPQEEIERRYAEAEARGEVMALDIVEKPDGRVIFQNAGRAMVEVTDRVPPIEPRPEYTGCGYLHNQNRNPPPPPPPKSGKKRLKYGNKITYIGWKKFDSLKEATFYQELMLRVKAGELKCVLRQVPFDLAEKERLQYFADFVAILPDNTIEAVYDVKSEPTRKSEKYIMKKKLMKELWDIEIQEV